MRTRTILISAATLAVAALLSGLMIPVVGQDKKTQPSEKAKPYVYVPDTVSPEYQAYLRKFPDPALRPRFPAPNDSNFVRQYQALDTAGQTVKLDLYHGMPHVL